MTSYKTIKKDFAKEFLQKILYNIDGLEDIGLFKINRNFDFFEAFCKLLQHLIAALHTDEITATKCDGAYNCITIWGNENPLFDIDFKDNEIKVTFFDKLEELLPLHGNAKTNFEGAKKCFEVMRQEAEASGVFVLDYVEEVLTLEIGFVDPVYIGTVNAGIGIAARKYDHEISRLLWGYEIDNGIIDY